MSFVLNLLYHFFIPFIAIFLSVQRILDCFESLFFGCVIVICTMTVMVGCTSYIQRHSWLAERTRVVVTAQCGKTQAWQFWCLWSELLFTLTVIQIYYNLLHSCDHLCILSFRFSYISYFVPVLHVCEKHYQQSAWRRFRGLINYWCLSVSFECCGAVACVWYLCYVKDMKTKARRWSPDVRQIDLDVNRTFRDHIMFCKRYDVKYVHLCLICGLLLQ